VSQKKVKLAIKQQDNGNATGADSVKLEVLKSVGGPAL